MKWLQIKTMKMHNIHLATCTEMEKVKKDAVTKDLNKAMYYYKKASDNGFPYSMFTIGTMYEKGEGVDKSIKNAAMWFKKTYEHDSIKKKVFGLWDSFRIAFLLDDHKDIYYKYRLLGYSSLDLKG